MTCRCSRAWCRCQGRRSPGAGRGRPWSRTTRTRRGTARCTCQRAGCSSPATCAPTSRHRCSTWRRRIRSGTTGGGSARWHRCLASVSWCPVTATWGTGGSSGGGSPPTSATWTRSRPAGNPKTPASPRSGCARSTRASARSLVSYLVFSSRNSGISRSVFVWYSAYGGYAATARSHQAARSSPLSSRAVMSHLSGPSCSSTRGFFLRL